MALDPYIARGVQPIDVTNAMYQGANLRMEQQRANAIDQRNALLDRRWEQVNQQEQDKERDLREMGVLYARAKAGDRSALDMAVGKLSQHPGFAEFAQRDPVKASEAAMTAMEQALGIEPQPAPAQLNAERVGGFEVLRDQTGKVYGQGRIREGGPSVVVAGGAAQGKPPQGYRWTDGGDLEPIPGGPAAAANNKPSLSPADMNKARVKLTQIKIARNQLENAKAKYAELKNTLSAGPGGALLPTPKGQAFDKAIDSMRGSITALTRVPGVGAMSDFETRLDQAKFPTRNLYEEVGAQQLQALDDLIGALEQGYSEMLGGPGPQSPAPESDPLAAHEGKVIMQGGRRYQVIRGANGKLFAQELK